MGDITEQIGTTATGTVVDRRGRPVPDAYVEPTIDSSDGSEHVDRGAQTSTAGAYVIQNLPAGRWSLALPFRAGYVPAARSVAATGFGAVSVDLVLRAKRCTTLRTLAVRHRGAALRVSGHTDNQDLFLPGIVRVEFGSATAPRSRRLGILICRRGRCAGRFRLPRGSPPSAHPAATPTPTPTRGSPSPCRAAGPGRR